MSSAHALGSEFRRGHEEAPKGPKQENDNGGSHDDDNDDVGDQQIPCKAAAPKARLICIPLWHTYATHPSAPRMQSNSGRMAGCAVIGRTEAGKRLIRKLEAHLTR